MPLISKAFSDLITFSRTGGTATYFAANGVLTAAAADVPRFDYDPATFLPRGLLIEEARTNLLLQSADFATTWVTGFTTIAANTTASPDGGTNGDKLQEFAVTNEHYVRQFLTGLTTNTTYTVSVFVKASERTRFRIRILDTDNVSNGYFADYNLTTVAANGSGTGAGSITGTPSITSVGNGWFRCVVSGNASTGTKYTVDFFILNAAGAINYLGIAGEGLFLWGAQCELGAFPTSYIPTTTTPLTRNADTANINTMSPWYNQVNGSVYAEFVSITDGSATQTNASQGVWSTTQSALASFNGYGNEVNLITNSAAKLLGRARYAPTLKNNIVQIGSTTGFIASNTIYKTAVAWDASNIVADSNIGALNSTANTAAVDMGTHNRMTLGNQNVGGAAPYQLNGWLRKITFYPTKLSDANLGTLTT